MDKKIRDRIANSYDQNAKYRESNEIVKWKAIELEKFINSLDDSKENYVLDLGAGSGIYAQYLSNRGLRLKCIDISKSMIDMCKDKNLDASVMDFYNLDFEENTFDAVWSLNTLLHVPKKSLVHILKGIKRILKSDGTFYLGIYGGKSSEGIYQDDFYTPHRFFARYEDEELKKTLQRYFEITSFEHIDIGAEEFWFQSVLMKNIK